jgi:uncharacterized protein (DUF1810 family)
MSDPYDLQRFVDEQNSGRTYERAVAELRRGRKTSHWMWFVLPQIAGLGRSPMSRRFAISGLDEARAYLRHPMLGPRLVETAGIVAETPDASALDVFGDLDEQKLQSSMTLFARAAPDEALFTRVLDRFFGGTGDVATERLLSAREPGSAAASDHGLRT